MLNCRIIKFIQIALAALIVFMLCWVIDYHIMGLSRSFYYVIYAVLLGAVVALLVSLIYEKHLGLKTFKMIDDLKVRLASFGDVAELTDVRFNDYISTIEMCILLYEKGNISLKEFYSQFGYRVEQLLKLQSANDVIRRYGFLIDIIGELKKKNLILAVGENKN